MKVNRFLLLAYLTLFFVACAPPAQDPNDIYHNEEKAKLAGLDLSAPSEQEEAENMIASRLQHAQEQELRAQGTIGWYGCRSGLSVPDPVTRKVIALTFDDGPNPATTNKILDILKARGIKATFFVLGSKAKANPEILKRMMNEGHLVASHSQTHKNFKTIGTAQTDYEIKAPHMLLTPYISHGRFFRFPYGISSCAGNDLLDSLGYQPTVGWHIDTCDWAMTDGNFDRSEARVCYAPAGPVNYVSHVMKTILQSGGGIALFHDIHAVTANNLNQIIGYLVAANFKFVRVDNKTYFPKLNKNLAAQAGKREPPAVSEPAASKSETRTRSQSVDEYFQ